MPGSAAAETQDFDAVVVGAGFAGLYMLYKLREQGLDVVGFETATDVGGTWYWNRYPGARCDIESVSYSYSFDPELEQEWTWLERFAPQPEILRYLEHVADRHELRENIRFSTTVIGAAFDESSRRWQVTTDQGDTIGAQFFIAAVGCLSTAKTPEIPGIDSFAGSWYHTGRWPHDGVDLRGQRVGLIGTGSSGIQSIPLIAEQAASLTVFQRTPTYGLPARNVPLDRDDVAEIKRHYPEYRDRARRSAFGVPIRRPERGALEVGEEEREATYRRAYDSGSVFALILSYRDILLNLAANETAADFLRRRIHEVVSDPAVAETLTPRDFPFGTKRPCLESGYYSTFNRANVELVDLRATPLVTVAENGIRTTDRSYDFDSLVFATGFDAITGSLLSLGIRGREGRSLDEEWVDGPCTYLGVAVAGFPNMFTITGPGSPCVLSNMVLSIEQHVDWIAAAIDAVRRSGASVMETTPSAQADWTAHVVELVERTLYPAANSWYKGANVDGKPQVFMAYTGGVNAYRKICVEVAEGGYEGFVIG